MHIDSLLALAGPIVVGCRVTQVHAKWQAAEERVRYMEDYIKDRHACDQEQHKRLALGVPGTLGKSVFSLFLNYFYNF